MLALMVGIFMVLSASGDVLPANYAELWLNENAAELKSAPEITEEMIPMECTYGVYGREGSWLYGTFSGEDRESAWEHYEKNNIYTNGQGYYRFIDRDTGEICIVNYHITVLFRNAFLRKYLPNVDMVLIILYAVLFLVHTVAVSIHFGKYMRERLDVLNEVTGEIKRQNLEFEKKHSELKEVEEVLDSLYQMKEALKISLFRQWDLEKSREEQIAALAHDIKTPLTVIRGNAELLEEGELAEEEAEYNRDILQSVSIMEEYLAILHEILLEKGEGTSEAGMEAAGERKGTCGGSGGKPEIRKVSCERLMDRLEEQARLLASARQCPVHFSRKEIRGEIWCNESQIVRAFQNIVGNALDHSPEGKGIRIVFSYGGKRNSGRNLEQEETGEVYLAAVVMDEGPGFSAEDLKHAAERFYQGDKSRSSKVHYGIGLHTAAEFVRVQGGYLTVENGENGGGRVTLYIRLR